ncbi:FecR family protein [Adhaeribacter arboris]|nr:FecR domain-containing protein [Adhaeribacter arboris]
MKTPIHLLIQKYLQGTATPEERALVEQYYNAFSGEQPYTPALSAEEKRRLEEKILAGIRQKIQGTVILKAEKEAKIIRMRPVKYLRVAAAVVGLLALAISYKLFFRANKVVLTTDYGEIATFTLPDSSKITLNGNSVVEYTPWNTTQNREIILQGEAFFSVKHTQNHQKFLVNVPGKMQVEVLGTEFNVTSRRNDSRVVLKSGKVRLHLPDLEQEIIMQPGEMVELVPHTTKVAKTKVNPEKYSSWSSKLLVLDKTSLRELVAILEDTYGLRVTVTDTSLLHHTFSGRVPKQDVEVLLLSLSKAFDLKISKNNNQITIQKE